MAKANNKKPTIEEVRRLTKELSNGQTVLISTEYHDCVQRLTFKCSCGNEFTRAWRKYKMGKTLCPACAYKLSGEKRRKHKEKPYRPRPKKRATEGYRPCSAIGKRTLHKRLKSWRKMIRELYDNTCPITGDKNNVVVHHLVSLDTIYSNTAKEYGFDCVLKRKEDFDNKEQFYQIVREVKRKHNDTTGILISSDVHKKFHEEYGYGNNTPNQFNEFLENNYQLSLNDILKRKRG